MYSPAIDTLSSLDKVAACPAGEPPFAITRLQFDIIRETEAIEGEWRDLSALPRNSLHQGFDWCHAWWSGHGHIPLVVRGRLDGRTVMILPLDVTSTGGFRIAFLAGSRFNNLNTGLFSADFPALAAAELRILGDALRTCLAPHADLLAMQAVPLTWDGTVNPLAGLVTTASPNPSLQLPLLGDMEKTIAQLNAKSRRKKYNVQRRRIEAVGGFEHICPQTVEEQHALLDLFFEQKAERFATSGLPDVFQPPEIRRFLHGLLKSPRTGTDTPLTLHALRLCGEHAGRVVAISGLSRKGGHVLCQFGSIDDRLCPEASPGELLFWLIIEESARQGAIIFDFGVGDQPYKRSWCTQTTKMYDILLPLTWKGRLGRRAVIGMSAARAAIKRRPRLYGLLQRLRSLRTR